MGYQMKWVTENLGISREAIRYYEKEKLLPANNDRKYREFSDEDIEKIWGIKLLIEIGFTAKEIHALMNDPNYDFDGAIAAKVAAMEKQYARDTINLEFAKSIKLLGRIPTTSKMGSVRFQDFLSYARENWNFYRDQCTPQSVKLADILTTKTPDEYTFDDLSTILDSLENLDAEEMMRTFTFHGHCQVLSEMQDLGVESDVVQRIVRIMHEHLVKWISAPELGEKFTAEFFAKNIAPAFVAGDIATLHERNYGKSGCLFIAQAIAHYGGYAVEDL